METNNVGAPLTRASMISPPSSPSTTTRPKSSLFSRLRRSPLPSTSTSTSSTPISIPMKHSLSSSNERGGPFSSYRKSQVGVPIMMGRNKSEEVFGSRKNGMALEDEVEWERVRTLPRVRLVPPEDEGEPIILYPPPHFLRPATPPPTLPHPFLSPPTSPPTSPPSRRMTSPPSVASPPRRPTSVYATNPTWAGMADGFVLPPPKFQRARGGWGAAPSGVVMPKKREQVVEDRRRRMSGVPTTATGWIDSVDGRPSSPPRKIRALESEEEIAANMLARIEETKHHSRDGDDSDMVDSSSAPDIEVPPAIPFVEVTPPSIIPEKNSEAFEAESPVVDMQPSEKQEPSHPTESAEPKSVRKTRALSLSAASSSQLSSSLLDQVPAPPVPSRPQTIKKQKSLKTFFFSSSTPASTSAPTNASVTSISLPKSSSGRKGSEDKPKERGRGILSRARSKPSLKIDVKMAKSTTSESFAGTSSSTTPTTPGLSTTQSELPASSYPETPSSTINPPHTATPTPRGLSKRFSLSNMSSAFKKRSSSTPVTGSLAKQSGVAVPRVPDLPDVYKKEKEARKVVHSAVPLGPSRVSTAQGIQEADASTSVLVPTRCESPSTMDDSRSSEESSEPTKTVSKTRSSIESVSRPVNPLAPLLPALDLSSTSTSASVSATHPDSPAATTISTTSLDDDEEDPEELMHAQLMQVSPRTRRDPAVSLQEYLGSGPARQGNVVIVPKGARRSVEAVVVLGLPAFVGNMTNETDGSSSLLGRVMEERRGSADTDETEMVVTPIQNPMEMFIASDPNAFDQPSSSAITSTEIIGQNDDGLDLDLDLESLPSDTVLVETPPPPPPPSSQTSTTATDSTPIPKGRFASPEALLRKLHTSSRKQHQQSTPYHSLSQAQALALREAALASAVAGKVPIPPIPLNEDGTIPSEAYSSLMNDVQLRSLHFEGLGLDFGDWMAAGIRSGGNQN
ncbi:hypothetical protein CI109_105978 [Kwoniella shandongensis]|uniref:Uncharacterized protein n=1 Tax=Kwoniella shandongensis TaxID=1734106 RepID=A0A5M6C2A0_9TREE|nr:uncharacterized protein CI109_003974 [Kwoniella shandongensis]KAA5527715.1 hypothetical protein CI109_003974 [Kwoniella shandongensis]